MASHRKALEQLERQIQEKRHEEMQRLKRKALRRDFYNGHLLVMTRGDGLFRNLHQQREREEQGSFESNQELPTDKDEEAGDDDSVEMWLGVRKLNGQAASRRT